MKDISSAIRLSNVIETMRFPLVVLVVIAHLVPFSTPRVVFPSDGESLYTFISEMFSHNLARLPVRCYFLISGYYLFKKFEDFNFTKFSSQILLKRVRTLLIPYLLWNVIMILAILLKNSLFAKIGLNTDDGIHMIKNSSLYDFFWGMPVNFPLWYMRDLMVMTLLAPLFFYFFKLTKYFGVILLLIIYLFVVESSIPGLSTTAITFFGIGGYLAIYGKNLLDSPLLIRRLSIVVAAVLLIVSTFMNGTLYHEYIVRLFIVVGVIGIINLFDFLNNYENIRLILVKFAPTSFFIYVIHEIYIINWLKGGWSKLPIYEMAWGKLLGYFIVPIICLSICIFIYSLLKKFVPKVLYVLTGGRMVSFKEKNNVKYEN